MCIISELKSTEGATDKLSSLYLKFFQLPFLRRMCRQRAGQVCVLTGMFYFFFLFPTSSKYMQQLTLEQERKYLSVWDSKITLLMAKSVPVKERN